MFFYSGRIRTLVAMATYSSHRLIMSHWGYLDFFFIKMFIEWSSTFHTTFVEIGKFDWLSGRQKVSIFVKMFKNLLLRNRMGDEAETWHTSLGH